MNRNWNVRDGIKGFGIKPRKPAPETAARWAVQKHTKLLSDAAALDLLLVPIGKKKEREIVRFLFRNATATVNDLRDLTEDEPLTPDALRKTIERLNALFREAEIPLEIVKEHGGSGFERVWLDIVERPVISDKFCPE